MGDWRGYVLAGIAVGAGGITAFAGVTLDRVRDVEQELAQSERELAARRSALIRCVSHEFRTPLTVVTGTVETLLARGLVADAGADLVSSLERASERLRRMIDTVLTVAQAADADHEDRQPQKPVDLVGAIRSAAGLDRPTSELARLDLEVEDAAENMMTVPKYVQLVLRETLDNAFRYSPSDCPVFVRVRRDDGEVRISVADGGPGMPAATVEQMFEPFVAASGATTRTHRGLGFGLYGVQVMTKQLGGRIDVTTSPRRGTTVDLAFPQRRATDLALAA